MDEVEFQPQQFGKYLLTERIGAGGMAEIFRATAFGVEGFTKEICIKRILPTLTSDETFVKMFIDEAKIAVSLHHANVVQVFDLGRIGEHYFIAMELVRGRDLLQIINGCRASRRRMPIYLAAYIVSEVCKGLDYAHRVKVDGRQGIVHRDVSPSNILVSFEGDVKVADFGIAKPLHQDQRSVTGTMKGKYGYMAPEQVKGEKVDCRSDVFAAGVLLWECLVGRRLFKGETDLETLELVREARVPFPPSAQNDKVSPEFDQLVTRALALNPDDRFQTASEMHQALANLLIGSGRWIDSKVMASFMQKLFAEDIRREDERSRTRHLTEPPFDVNAMYLGPPTRPDVPFLQRRRMSPMAVALLGTGIILLLGALVVTTVWLAYQPAPTVVTAELPLTQTTSLRLGLLSIESEPAGAAVFFDGLSTGQYTPTSLNGLDRSKAHRIELKLEGYQTWSREVHFDGAETLAVEAALSAKHTPDPEPEPRQTRESKPTLGTLNVNAEGTWAYVIVDGKQQERTTPLYGLKLRPGTHTIELQNPKLGQSQTRSVTIRAGQTVNLVVKLN